jgi:hypothetical protein
MSLLRIASTAALLVAACDGPPSAAAPVVYVGVLHDGDLDDATDGDASIALVVQGELVQAYACGDVPSEAYPGWFLGSAHAGGQSAQLAQEVRTGWQLEATWTDDRAQGTLMRPDGTRVTWTATAAHARPPSGLYAAWSEGCMTGVIVDATAAVGASDPVVRGTWCNAAGERRQVTPLRPVRLVNDQLTVQVMLDEGPRRLEVSPVRLAPE